MQTVPVPVYSPWIRFGQDNELELEIVRSVGKGKANIEKLSLDFYKPADYP